MLLLTIPLGLRGASAGVTLCAAIFRTPSSGVRTLGRITRPLRAQKFPDATSFRIRFSAAAPRPNA